MEGEDWHIVEARRDDGAATMFRIRELAPLPHLATIFVVEMPYPITQLSRLPDAAGYRRLAEFEHAWLRPAATALGWELVGQKTEDGSFFLYMYGAGDPNDLIARLSPFDANLGFYDDADPGWLEYGTLRELLDQAKAIPTHASANAKPDLTAPVRNPATASGAKTNGKARTSSKTQARSKSTTKAKSKKKRAKTTAKTTSKR